MAGSEVHNLNAGRLRHHAAFVVPSVFALFALVGLTVRPDFERLRAHDDLALAQRRLEERNKCEQRLSELGALGGIDRLEAVLRRARAALPPAASKLDIHGALRRLLARAGVELTRLEIRESYDPGFEHLEDVAALREVSLMAESTLLELVRFLSSVRSLGRPVAMLELRLTRTEVDGTYRWTLVTGLFESASLARFGGAVERATEEAMP